MKPNQNYEVEFFAMSGSDIPRQSTEVNASLIIQHWATLRQAYRQAIDSLDKSQLAMITGPRAGHYLNSLIPKVETEINGQKQFWITETCLVKDDPLVMQFYIRLLGPGINRGTNSAPEPWDTKLIKGTTRLGNELYTYAVYHPEAQDWVYIKQGTGKVPFRTVRSTNCVSNAEAYPNKREAVKAVQLAIAIWTQKWDLSQIVWEEV